MEVGQYETFIGKLRRLFAMKSSLKNRYASEMVQRYAENIRATGNPNSHSQSDKPLLHFLAMKYIELAKETSSVNWLASDIDWMEACLALIKEFLEFKNSPEFPKVQPNMYDLGENDGNEKHVFDIFDFNDPRFREPHISESIDRLLTVLVNA